MKITREILDDLFSIKIKLEDILEEEKREKKTSKQKQIFLAETIENLDKAISTLLAHNSTK